MSTTAWIALGGFVWVLVELNSIYRELRGITNELGKLSGVPSYKRRRRLSLKEALEEIETEGKQQEGVLPSLQQIHGTLAAIAEYLLKISVRMEERWPAESESQEKSRRKARWEATMASAKEWLKQNPDKPLPEELKAELWPWGVATVKMELEMEAKRHAPPEGDEPEAPESKG